MDTSTESSPGAVGEWSAGELVRRLETGQPLLVLDIREAAEYAEWHIPGSSNLPVYDAINNGDLTPLLGRLDYLPQDRPIVTVCRRGNTSQHAVRLMKAHGLDAVNLSGGMRAWGGVWTLARLPLPGGATGHLVQLRRNGKGCLSYFFGARGEGAVVDPSLDAEVYLELARQHDSTITHVFETHVHADHVSRARNLSRQAGAALHLARNDRVTYTYEPLEHEQQFDVGGVEVRVLMTPGHTQESVSLLVAETYLLSGDTLFVDGVGRPDLERGQEGVDESAEFLYQSLHERILPMPRTVRILPGHASGEIGYDGTPIEATLESLARDVELLRTDRAQFVQHIKERLGAQPPNYPLIIAVNEGKFDIGSQDPLDLEAGPNRCAVS